MTQLASVSAHRKARRLSDKILVAFHAACDERNWEVARGLIQVVEGLVARAPAGGERRRPDEGIVAAQERTLGAGTPEAAQEAMSCRGGCL
jgi:hypothetical protein